MARTTINTQVIPDETIVSADLSYPLTDFSSTGIDDNATGTKLTVSDTGIDVTGTVVSDGLESSTGLDFTAVDGITISTKESAVVRIDSDDNDSSRVFQVVSGTTGSSETLILASEDAGVTLYYDNAAKLATTSTGIDVTSANTHANSVNVASFANTTTGEPVAIALGAVADNGGAGNEGGIYFDAGADGSAANNQLQFNADHQSSVTPDMVITGSGNVGIGTSSPSQEFHLRQTSGDCNLLIDSANGASQIFFGDDESVNIGAIRYDHASNYMRFSTNSAERMRIDSSGRFLINKVSTTGALQLEVLAPTGFSVVSGFYSPSTQSTIDFKDANTTANYKVRIGSETDDLLLFAGGSERMRIDSIGRLLLGQSANVSGFALQLQGSGGSGGDLSLTSDSSKAEIQSFNNKPLHINRQGNNTLLNEGGGDVGIGTSSPDSILHLSGSSSSKIIIENSASPRGNYIGINSSDNLVIAADEDNLGTNSHIQFRVDASERMRIDSSGSVGIGLSSPALNVSYNKIMHVHSAAGLGSLVKVTDSSTGFTTNDGSDFLQYGADLYILNRENGTMRFSTNVTERMRIDSSGRVGIGTSDPSSGTSTYYDDLVIKNDTSGTGAGITIQSNTTNGFGAVEFRKADGTQVGKIYASSAGGQLAFETGGSERMRIDSSGNVGIGVSSVSPVISSSKTLQINSSGNTTLSVRAIDSVNDRSAILELLSSGNGVSKSIILYGDTDTTPGTASPLVIQKYHSGVRSEVGRFNTLGHLVLGDSTTAYYRLKSGATGTDGGMQWMFNTDATVFASLTLPYDTRATTGLHLYSGYPITYTVPSNKAHQFVTGSSEAARIDADGLKFNGDTAAANALDDYEEGSWTPAITGTAGIPSITYSYRVGYYIKTGNAVIARWGMRINTISGGSGTLRITGLPYTAKYYGPYQQPSCFSNTQGLTTDADGPVLFYAEDSQTTMQARLMDNSDTPMPLSYCQAGSWCIGTMIYDVT